MDQDRAAEFTGRVAANPVCAGSLVTDLVTRARTGDKRAWDVLVERYAPLIWSICRSYRLGRRRRRGRRPERLAAPGGPAGQHPRSGRAARVARHHHLAGVRASPARSPRIARADLRIRRREPPGRAGRHGRAGPARGRAPRGAARGAHSICRRRRRLIALLIADPPVPYAEISAKLGIPVGSIGPSRRRCLDKLRRDPTLAALINAAEATSEQGGRPSNPERQRAGEQASQ